MGFKWFDYIGQINDLTGTYEGFAVYPSRGPNQTVKFKITSLAGTEVTNATNLSGYTFRFVAQGY